MIYAETTSQIGQSMFEKLGYNTFNSLAYEDFEYNGGFPLADIKFETKGTEKPSTKI
jgi:hypothetical protein